LAAGHSPLGQTGQARALGYQHQAAALQVLLRAAQQQVLSLLFVNSRFMFITIDIAMGIYV
jgi:hypothetical protein